MINDISFEKSIIKVEVKVKVKVEIFPNYHMVWDSKASPWNHEF